MMIVGKKVAVVTGGNRGLGREVVRQLAEELPPMYVVFTSRSEAAGKAIVDHLKNDSVSFFVLDVTDPAGVDAFKEHLKTKFGGIDILVQNSAVGVMDEPASIEKTERVIGVNVFGLIDVWRKLSPLLRPGGRVVNVSSTAGWAEISNHTASAIRERVVSPLVSVEDIETLAKEFIDAERVGKTGWMRDWLRELGETVGVRDAKLVPYSVSKYMVIALSDAQGREAAANDVVVNSVCPGWCTTEMGEGPRSTAAGAKSIIAALQLVPFPPPLRNGQFYWETEWVDWRESIGLWRYTRWVTNSGLQYIGVDK